VATESREEMESLPLLVADDGSFAAPSELVVASSLRDSFPEFLEEGRVSQT
jgi:hypothetical protein